MPLLFHARPVVGGTTMHELTTSQATQQYGTNPNVLLRLILMGRLEARKNAEGRWLISKASLERWNAQRVRRAPKTEQRAALGQMPNAAHSSA